MNFPFFMSCILAALGILGAFSLYDKKPTATPPNNSLSSLAAAVEKAKPGDYIVQESFETGKDVVPPSGWHQSPGEWHWVSLPAEIERLNKRITELETERDGLKKTVEGLWADGRKYIDETLPALVDIKCIEKDRQIHDLQAERDNLNELVEAFQQRNRDTVKELLPDLVAARTTEQDLRINDLLKQIADLQQKCRELEVRNVP